MRRTISGVVLALLAGGVPTSAFSQSVPNLTGTWILQADKSDFGPMPGPANRTDVIDHQEPKLNIKRTVTMPTGETTSDLVYLVDGKPHKNTAGGSELSSVLHWEAQTLVMVSTVQSPQGEATITDRISLSEDAKTMTLARTIAVAGQQLNQTMVLAKQ